MPYNCEEMQKRYAESLSEDDRVGLSLEQQVIKAIGQPEDAVNKLAEKMYLSLSDEDKELLAYLWFKGYVMDHISGAIFLRMKAEGKYVSKKVK